MNRVAERRWCAFSALKTGLASLIVLAMPFSDLGVSHAQETGAITLSQILEAPDDVELNMRYAKQQAEDGDLISAASAVERILYSTPNWHSARLFYVDILMRLDDPQAASSELEKLATIDLSPQQRAEYNRLKQDIDARERKWSISGVATAGTFYNDNAGGAFNNDLNDDLTQVVGNDTGDGGVSASVSGRLNYQLFELSDTQLFFTGGAATQNYFELSDRSSASVRVGAGAETGSGALRWGGLVRHQWVYLNGKNFLKEGGASAFAQYAVNPRTDVSASVSIYDQTYLNVLDALFESERSGTRVRVEAGGSYRPTSTTLIGGRVGYEDKEADREPYGYDGPYGLVFGSYQFDQGFYVSGRAEVKAQNYKAVETLLANPVQREDTRISGRLAAGTTLAKLASLVTDSAGLTIARDLIVEAGVNYSDRDSNAAPFLYQNTGVDLRLAYRFKH